MAGRYAPIRSYAAIGDGRTVALIARDGSIDWLCLPNLDSPTVFAALLDVERGGSFALSPEGAHEVARRYLPGTNVLESTFTTATGVVRITDGMVLPDGQRLAAGRELVRRVEGLAGRVAMRWQVDACFGYASRPARIEMRGACPVAVSRGDAVGVCAWEAGDPVCGEGSVTGTFEAREGHRALVALAVADRDPLVFAPREHLETRLDRTVAFWERWTSQLRYDGPWKEAVIRSALVLKLLVFSPSGAIAAAATTSLPEAIGGERNWDYRFCWIRDASFTLEALLQLGCWAEAHSFFWWFLHATRLTHPRLQPFYRLDGGAHAPERTMALEGYCGSRPVRVGNGAASQLQLDTYGSLLDAAWLYSKSSHPLDGDTARELAEATDLVADIWRTPDRGIWEVRMPGQHFTQSKVMCWVALDRATRLAHAGQLPRAHLERWHREARAIREFVETRCWSEQQQSYVRFAGSEELDASLLLLALVRYQPPTHARIVATIEAIRRRLGDGPLVYRYSGADGLPSGEGVFLCCSFWLVEALALAGRLRESADLMEQLLGLANDVGLYAEEIDRESHDFLGNFPQALVHLALIGAARAVAERTR